MSIRSRKYILSCLQPIKHAALDNLHRDDPSQRREIIRFTRQILSANLSRVCPCSLRDRRIIAKLFHFLWRLWHSPPSKWLTKSLRVRKPWQCWSASLCSWLSSLWWSELACVWWTKLKRLWRWGNYKTITLCKYHADLIGLHFSIALL